MSSHPYIEHNGVYGIRSDYNSTLHLTDTHLKTTSADISVNDLREGLANLTLLMTFIDPTSSSITGTFIGTGKLDIVDDSNNLVLDNSNRTFQGDVLNGTGGVLLDYMDESIKADILDSNNNIILNHTNKTFKGSILATDNSVMLNYTTQQLKGDIIALDDTLIFNATTKKIVNLAAPTDDDDAATKEYVDNAVLAGSSYAFRTFTEDATEDLQNVNNIYATAGGTDPTATARLQDGNSIAEYKRIILIAIIGAATQLNVIPQLNNFIDADGATPSAITFDTVGQSLTIIWSGSNWYLTNGGATMVP